MNFLLLLVLVGSSTLWGQVSYVPPTKVLKERGSEIKLSVDSFTTSKVIDQEGKSVGLNKGESFQRYQGEVGGLFGLTNDFNLGFGARYRHQTSSFTQSNEDINAVGSGFQSLFARFLYAFEPTNRMQFTLEGLFRYVPYKNDENDSPTTDDLKKLALGDEGNEYSIGMGVTYSTVSNNHFTFRGGWRRPGTDLSTEFYWNGEIATQFRWVTPLAGVDGVTSLKNATYESDPNNRPTWNTRPSALYNSINREWIAPYVGVNFAFSPIWRVELRGQQVVSGRSTDLGTGFGIALVRRMDASEEKLVDSKFKTYDLEATVTKVSAKKSYVVVDKGMADDIEKGMKFDFYDYDYVGGNTLVARGVVIKVSSDKAIVKLTHRYNHAKEIKEGLVGRTSLK